MHEQPSGCTQQHSALPTGSTSGWKGSLYAATVPSWFLLSEQVAGDMLQRPCMLAREPGWSSCHYPSAGKHKQWCSLVHRSWVVPSAPRELLWFPNILSATSPLLCRSCSTGSLLSLRRKCPNSECTCHVFLGGGKLLLCCHLGPPPTAQFQS